MKLIEIKDKVTIEVVRNGEFESLGLVTDSKPKQLVFIEDAKYLQSMLKNSNISSVVTTEELNSSIPEEVGVGIYKNPREVFYAIHNYLAEYTDFYGESFDTEIASTAKIHPTAYVAPKSVRIGEGCEIGPNVSILQGSILEKDVIVRAGSVIGVEGFQVHRIEGKIMPVIHSGGVLIHNRVEIQALSCISKALFGGFTEIGEDTKLSSMVRIAHNVRIGTRCIMGALVAVAGSTVIGDDVWIGPSATISSELIIGKGASIVIGSVVMKSVPAQTQVMGNPARVTKSLNKLDKVVPKEDTQQPTASLIAGSVEERIRIIAAETFNLKDLPVIESTPRDLEGWDSVGNLNLILAMEQAFQITFNDDVISEIKSLRDISYYVMDALKDTAR